jgi:hypothetical protein
VNIFRISVFSVFVLCSTTLLGQKHWQGISSPAPQPASVRLVESNTKKTIFTVNLEGFVETAVVTPRGKESVISLENSTFILGKGYPALSQLSVPLIIPDLDHMELKVIAWQYEEFEDVAVAPSKGHFTRDVDPADIPYVYGPAYLEDAFWPQERARLESPFIMRDVRGQAVVIYPFSYNPVAQVLRVYTHLTLEVKSSGQPGENPLHRNKALTSVTSDFAGIYDQFFLNAGSAFASKYLVEEDGSMLIICYDDYMDAMQPFVNWKRTIGRSTTMVPVSEAGSTASAIKSFVQSYYQQHPELTFLLLVGDAPQVPTKTTTWGHSDNAYGFLTGNDQYNEIFVGRFSAENAAHVQTQVQRTIEYERDITYADTWLNLAMGVARNEGAGYGHNGGEADHVHMDFIRDTLLGFTYAEVHREYEGVPGMSNTNATIISNHINNGVGIINYCNHGSTTSWSVAGYNINHIHQLTNVGRLPFIWSVACVNGNFVSNYCFAEAWMRSTHNGQPTGAIGTMMSTINQPWHPPMTGQDEMVRILTGFNGQTGGYTRRTFGGISINGSMLMIPSYGSQGILTHVTWTLFGDPSLMVRTAAPQEMHPTYDPVVILGFDHFVVNAPDADGASVTLSWFDQAQNQVVILDSKTLEDGQATLYFDALQQEKSLTLAITGFNKQTYLNEEILVVAPDGPFMIFDQYTVNDEAGNNNGLVDYDETISLGISMRNVGIDAATDAVSVLSTSSDYITMINDTYHWGDIGSSTQVSEQDIFSFKVSPDVPDRYMAHFTLELIAGDENSWNIPFAIRVNAPVLSAQPLQVNDSLHGNGDGMLNAGEQALVIVRVKNTGNAEAREPYGLLQANSPYLSLIVNESLPGSIAPGDSVDLEFEVQAHASLIDGMVVDVDIFITDGQQYESQQALVIGYSPEVQIGKGLVESNQFPFYNYHRSNRSQMIYLASELGGGEKIISKLGFDFMNVSASYNKLPNFNILMKHTSQSTVSGFENMDDATLVFSAAEYHMPETPGWHYWDLSPFSYDGESNLMIEVVWGQAAWWTWDYFKVASTFTGAQRTAYGYSDHSPTSPYIGASSVRPNIFLAFEVLSGALEKELNVKVINGSDENPIADAIVTIGTFELHTNAQGQGSISLLPGLYNYQVAAPGFLPMTEASFQLEGESLELVVDLQALQLFTVSFLIRDEEGHEVGDVELHFDGQPLEPFLREVEVLRGTYSYQVSSDGYADVTGQVEVTGQDMVVEIVLENTTGVIAMEGKRLNVYPNPARDFVYLDYDGVVSAVELLDASGRLVRSQGFGSEIHTIDVRGLDAGVYFLRIITPDSVLSGKIQVAPGQK